MGWKFWQRGTEAGASRSRLPKPREMPEQIGRHLVVQEKMNPDYVWALKCVLKPHSADRKGGADFRVFSANSASEARVKVSDYDSLNAHPELIVCQGMFDRRSNRVELHKGVSATPAK